jgi:hypothetical protein
MEASVRMTFALPTSARVFRRFFLAVLGVLSAAHESGAADFRTANFIVAAPTPELAQKIGAAAEHYRQVLAEEWLGKPLPRWSRPCPITAQVGPHLGAGGVTSFVFDHGEVYNWTMTIQGNEQRIIDSVLPHEITHTVFASHFRRPLPRWADEGACTTVEHPVERGRQHRLLIEFLRTGRGIAFPDMFAMREYPPDVLPLYAQGYSLARYLIERGGRRKYVAFLAEGLTNEDWSRALATHYGVGSVDQMQQVWLDWVKKDCPAPPAGLATVVPPTQPGLAMARGQSPDPAGPAAPARRSIYVGRHADQPAPR